MFLLVSNMFTKPEPLSSCGYNIWTLTSREMHFAKENKKIKLKVVLLTCSNISVLPLNVRDKYRLQHTGQNKISTRILYLKKGGTKCYGIIKSSPSLTIRRVCGI